MEMNCTSEQVTLTLTHQEADHLLSLIAAALEGVDDAEGEKLCSLLMGL